MALMYSTGVLSIARVVMMLWSFCVAQEKASGV
jgi:hypothetical protein